MTPWNTVAVKNQRARGTTAGGFRSDIQKALELAREGDGDCYYPALALPLGKDDTIVCPPQHVDYLRTKLSESTELDLLVIGYSALDQRALEIFDVIPLRIRQASGLWDSWDLVSRSRWYMPCALSPCVRATRFT